MFSHIMVGTNDLDRSKKFYDAVLGVLGAPAGFVDRHRVFWRTPTGTFGASLPINGEPAAIGNGSTIGFLCAISPLYTSKLWATTGRGQLCHGNSLLPRA